MWRVLGGVFMGWSLGTNDAANIFGTGVAARVISIRLANILMVIFVIAGAIIEGPKCMSLMKEIGCLTANPAFIATLSAAVTMTVMSFAGIPSSTSQAIMGGIIGAGMAAHRPFPDTGILLKIVLCWTGTPIGAGIAAFILMLILRRVQSLFLTSAKALNVFIRVGLIVAGSYGSYTLGANNVANTTGVYYACGMLSAQGAAIIGGVAIALGAVTFGRRVMETVGNKITDVGPLGALVAVMASALTIHLYTQVGVPVSSSQAIVGAVVGVGLVHGFDGIYKKQLIEIFLGWLATPVSAGVLAYLACLFVP